ncbi:MAG TPA: hypothetical protein VEA40_00540 [Ramlibacter sp.]|nr:hypothetical protein [Ramlibacter sp.]
MMDEVKELIGMLNAMPALALWVLVGFWAYKVIVVGSIYGVIRFVVGKLAEVLMARKAREVEYKEIRPMLDGICITGETDRLMAQLHRLRGVGVGIDSKYIHGASVDWLRQAIDDRMEKDRASKPGTTTQLRAAA